MHHEYSHFTHTIKGGGERERETDRQTDRQTDTGTDRDQDRDLPTLKNKF